MTSWTPGCGPKAGIVGACLQNAYHQRYCDYEEK